MDLTLCRYFSDLDHAQVISHHVDKRYLSMAIRTNKCTAMLIGNIKHPEKRQPLLRRRTMKFLLSLALLLSVSVASAQQNELFLGKLHSGIAAIGGETTGYVLESKKAMYDLYLSRSLMKIADDNDQEQAIVIGKEVRIYGVERGEYMGIVVEDMFVVGQEVSLTGEIDLIMSIGGATTGVVLNYNGVIIDLEVTFEMYELIEEMLETGHSQFAIEGTASTFTTFFNKTLPSIKVESIFPLAIIF
jgi:hypothetical protein